jgi:drug/metabolite transporter (DMT)-like permease
MKRWHADGLLLAVAAIWGLAFVPQSWGMETLGPMSFTALRFALGALVVAPLAWREHRRGAARPQPAGGPPRALLLATLGVLIFLGAALQQIGLVSTSVTHASFLTALYVPLVPLLGWLLFRRRPHAVIWPAAFGCVVGTWLLTGADAIDIVVGDWWVIASSLPWALHVVLVGWAAGRLGAPYTVACAQFVVCAALSGLAALWLETISLDAVRAAAGAIAYTGLVSVGIGYTAQVVAQRHTHPADAALLLSAETVFAALFGALLAGDRLSTSGLAGCALILACIVIAQVLPMWQRRG